jgi:hypothetical protein
MTADEESIECPAMLLPTVFDQMITPTLTLISSSISTQVLEYHSVSLFLGVLVVLVITSTVQSRNMV